MWSASLLSDSASGHGFCEFRHWSDKCVVVLFSISFWTMISYFVITPFGRRGLDQLANKDVDDVFTVVRPETSDGTKTKQN